MGDGGSTNMSIYIVECPEECPSASPPEGMNKLLWRSRKCQTTPIFSSSQGQ